MAPDGKTALKSTYSVTRYLLFHLPVMVLEPQHTTPLSDSGKVHAPKPFKPIRLVQASTIKAEISERLRLVSYSTQG